MLERRGLLARKGFPESYDVRRLVEFLTAVRLGQADVRAPVYSHQAYDIVPGEYQIVDRPDIVIVEGLNVLQTGEVARGRQPRVFVSDFFDFSIYIDADEADIEAWYVDRFLTLRATVFQDARSYFHRYAALADAEAVATAREIWRTINGVNLRENIAPTRERAQLVLEKGHGPRGPARAAATDLTSGLKSEVVKPSHPSGLRPALRSTSFCLAASLAARRASASLRFPALFRRLEQERRNRHALPELVDRHERQVGEARVFPLARERALREDVDLDLQRRPEHRGDLRPQDDQVADLDRVQELQPVDGGGDDAAARVAMTGNRAGDVDEVHDGAAEHEPERVRVVRQHHLHHLGGGICGTLRG